MLGLALRRLRGIRELGGREGEGGPRGRRVFQRTVHLGLTWAGLQWRGGGCRVKGCVQLSRSSRGQPRRTPFLPLCLTASSGRRGFLSLPLERDGECYWPTFQGGEWGGHRASWAQRVVVAC